MAHGAAALGAGIADLCVAAGQRGGEQVAAPRLQPLFVDEGRQRDLAQFLRHLIVVEIRKDLTVRIDTDAAGVDRHGDLRHQGIALGRDDQTVCR